jgi:hypothetical protein
MEINHDVVMAILFTTLFFLILGLVFVAILGNFLFQYYETPSSSQTQNMTISTQINQDILPPLETILHNEIKSFNMTEAECEFGWCKCLDYANWYNNSLTIKHPELDIYWLRHVDICNDLTLCDSYHTYLIVNGYGEECILDQKIYSCIQLLSLNVTCSVSVIGNSNMSLTNKTTNETTYMIKNITEVNCSHG